MTHITDARVIGNHAAMGMPTPTATNDTPFLTVMEIFRAGVRCRAARRMEMAAAQSTWHTDSGAIDQRRTAVVGSGPLVPRVH